MYLLSCYSFIQVVLIIVSALVFSSQTVPLNPSSHSRSLDVEQIIDPLNPDNHYDDLESKKVLPKSILFTPLRTAAPPINQCPPGHLSREDGTCIKTITGITLNEETLVAVLDNFYKSKRKPSSNRHRHRTTTTPRPKVLDFIPTTTEVITESPFESTTATTMQPPSLLIHQVVTSEINPTIYPETTTNPEAETTTILSTSTAGVLVSAVNEPGVPGGGGHEIRNQNQPTPLHTQQQIYDIVPTETSISTEMSDMTESSSVPLELTTFQPFPDQLLNVTSPTDNPLNNITVISSSDVIINPDGNNNDDNEATTSKPSSPSPPPHSLHELQQINDDLVPTTTTTHPTPQEYITEMNVPLEFETSLPPSSFEPLQILNITFTTNSKILPNDNITTNNNNLTFRNETRNEEEVEEEEKQQVHQHLFPSLLSSFLFLNQDKLGRLEKESKELVDKEIIETVLEPHQAEKLQEENEEKVMKVVILHDNEKEKEEERKKPQVQNTLSTTLSFHDDKDELIIVPVSSTQESKIIVDSKSSNDTVIKQPF